MLRVILLLFMLLMSSMSIKSAYAQDTQSPETPSSELTTLLEQLPKTKLRGMPQLIEKIAEVNHPVTRLVLASMLEGELYYIKSSKLLVIARSTPEKRYQLSDIYSGELLDTVKKSKISKVRSNNRIRSTLRGLIARLDLSSDDKNVRLAAVQQSLNSPTDSSLAIISQLAPNETDGKVRQLMQTVIALDELKNGDIATKIKSLEQLSQSLEPSVKNAMVKELEALNDQDLDDKQLLLQNELNKALDKIEGKVKMFGFIENVFFGLSLGSVLLLAAIGLAITFGVMGVINMAHGEMIMLGAYTTYVVQLAFPNLIGYSLLIAVPAAFIVSGTVGILIERGVIRFLKGRPLETLLATFGISLILQQLVRTVFSPLNRQVSTPEWMSGSLQINPIFSLTYNRLYILLFSIMVFVALLLILKKTSLGLHVRAVSQNRSMARALSVKSDWVDAITFGLGSGIAGVAGVVLSQLTNVGPNLGQAYIIDSFLVVVFGGVGNLWGTLVAAMSLGLTNKFLEPFTGSVLANIIVLVGLVLFIQKRPKGLFPQKGRAADD